MDYKTLRRALDNMLNWFSKRGKPSEPSSIDRYHGRPLLILLENYIMSAIGSLPPDKEHVAASITQRVFGGGEDWRSTLRTTLRLGDSLDETLRQMWATNQEKAQKAGATLTVEEFARMVADDNFVHLITPTA